MHMLGSLELIHFIWDMVIYILFKVPWLILISHQILTTSKIFSNLQVL